ncbi:MAG: porin, partial [Pseudomonadota bacterium]
MKRILLTSTALVAFAGAAAADISLSGDANLKYIAGDTVAGTTTADRYDWGVDINVTASQELDNGLTASASFEMDLIDDTLGDSSTGLSDYRLSLVGENAGLYFGDTEGPAANRWSSAGDMEADGFSAQDGGTGEVYLRGDATFGAVDISIGGIIGEVATVDTDTTYQGNNATFEQLGFSATASLGTVNVIVAYQEEGPAALEAVSGDYTPNEILGIALSTTLGGATIELAYADKTSLTGTTDGETSTGIEITYPVSDAITLGAYYVNEEEDDATVDDNVGVSIDYSAGALTLSAAWEQEQSKDGIDVNIDYDLGNGFMLQAGASGEQDDDGYYIGATYDLGNGGEVEIVHVDADNLDSGDEYFEGDWAVGTTI